MQEQTLLASQEHTPKLAAYYHDLSLQIKRNLHADKYIVKDEFKPQAEIWLTTRCGGQSKSPYACFNVAHHVGDDLEQVGANRRQIFSDMGCEHLCFMEQTHSNRVCVVTTKQDHDALSKDDNDVVLVNEPIVSGIDCDGLVTNEPKVALAVMTADCLPLLLCDPLCGVVAAIHCGWRGIKRGIIPNALAKMCALNAQLANIKAFMGPAIGAQSFEIGSEVKEIFMQQSAQYASAFTQEQAWQDGQLVNVANKYLCDIYALCRICLHLSGVSLQHISGGEFDTRMQDDVFYSYRKSAVTGRLVSIVCLN